MSEKRKVNRPKRSRIELKNKLAARPREGYRRRWVNKSNYEDRYLLGYRPVDGDEDVSQNLFQDGSKQGSSMIVRNAGGGEQAILMEIPEDVYQEYKAEGQAEIDQIEESLSPAKSGDPSRYGSLKIEHKK